MCQSESEKKKCAVSPARRAWKLAYGIAYTKSHKEEIAAQRRRKSRPPVRVPGAERGTAAEPDLHSTGALVPLSPRLDARDAGQGLLGFAPVPLSPRLDTRDTGQDLPLPVCPAVPSSRRAGH